MSEFNFVLDSSFSDPLTSLATSRSSWTSDSSYTTTKSTSCSPEFMDFEEESSTTDLSGALMASVGASDGGKRGAEAVPAKRCSSDPALPPPRLKLPKSHSLELNMSDWSFGSFYNTEESASLQALSPRAAPPCVQLELAKIGRKPSNFQRYFPRFPVVLSGPPPPAIPPPRPERPYAVPAATSQLPEAQLPTPPASEAPVSQAKLSEAPVSQAKLPEVSLPKTQLPTTQASEAPASEAMLPEPQLPEAPPPTKPASEAPPPGIIVPTPVRSSIIKTVSSDMADAACRTVLPGSALSIKAPENSGSPASFSSSPFRTFSGSSGSKLAFIPSLFSTAPPAQTVHLPPTAALPKSHPAMRRARKQARKNMWGGIAKAYWEYKAGAVTPPSFATSGSAFSAYRSGGEGSGSSASHSASSRSSSSSYLTPARQYSHLSIPGTPVNTGSPIQSLLSDIGRTDSEEFRAVKAAVDQGMLKSGLPWTPTSNYVAHFQQLNDTLNKHFLQRQAASAASSPKNDPKAQLVFQGDSGGRLQLEFPCGLPPPPQEQPSKGPIDLSMSKE